MTNRLLNDNVTTQVKEIFDQLQEPVEVLFFGSQVNCDYCNDTLQLVTEVVETNDKLSLNVYDIDLHAELARQYKVDKTPGMVIVGRDCDQILDYGIRYFGIPAGHEFSSLIHTMLLVSNRDSGLSAEAREYLSNLGKPVHLQVFVTPT